MIVLISGLPNGFDSKDFRTPSRVPCVMQLLCEKHEGIVVEAKSIKEHWWKPYIKKLFDKKVYSLIYTNFSLKF